MPHLKMQAAYRMNFFDHCCGRRK